MREFERGIVDLREVFVAVLAVEVWQGYKGLKIDIKTVRTSKTVFLA